MKKNVPIFSLEELEEPMADTNAEISAGLASAVREKAFIAVFELYAKYLLDNKLVSDKQEALSKVSAVISVAMDRGDCSVTALEQVKAYIDQYAVMTEQMSVEANKCCFQKHLIKMMARQLSDNQIGALSEEESAEVKTFQELSRQYHEAKAALCNRLGGVVNASFNSVLTTYGPNFDKGFLAQYSC